MSNRRYKFRYTITVADTIDVEEVYVPPMFIQPFVENSIEHGLKGVKDGLIEVNIQMNDDRKLVECKITDNGIGISKASEFKNVNKPESFSGKIIKERLQIYSKSLRKKASFPIKEVTDGTGTEVNMLLPYLLED
ncbi:hypothetical protein [Aquimarina sp. SS2-1]|uniref:hypothetical protein n=1 Tax=Aquimarina besae TaxID=3342247 RepID=UPI003670DBFB